MSWAKRFQWAGAAVALGMMTALCAGCGAQSAKEELLLYLAFDETEGNEASDSAGKVETAEVQYQYTHATYTDAMDPEWRTCGVKDGALLFDGSSTYIEYGASELCVGGDAFSVSVWVAPRAFEWDDPEAEANGTEQ
jgi:hypothetical protein